MDLDTFVRTWNIANVVIHIPILIIALKYGFSRVKLWRKKYPKRKLNAQQIHENIHAGRRIDYATGIEKNWKHTWNTAQPKEHKWREYIFIVIKGFILITILHKIAVFLLMLAFAVYMA